MRAGFLFLAVFLAVASLRAEPDAPEGYKNEMQVTPLLRTLTTVAGQPIVYSKTDEAQATAVFVEIPPGAQTGWHKHPLPCFSDILSGALDLEIEGGKIVRLAAGWPWQRASTFCTRGQIPEPNP